MRAARPRRLRLKSSSGIPPPTAEASEAPCLYRYAGVILPEKASASCLSGGARDQKIEGSLSRPPPGYLQ
jgi:hypothetical protein